jgi:hypothetical protein
MGDCKHTYKNTNSLFNEFILYKDINVYINIQIANNKKFNFFYIIIVIQKIDYKKY